VKLLHYHWYRFKWFLTEHTNYTPKVPLHLDLELTNQCNLKCTMCRHGIDPEPNQGQMSTENAYKIIEQAGDLGIPSMKFQFRGESALHKDLEELIYFAKHCRILETQLNTNLVAFNKHRIKKLCDSGLDRIIVSIDGANKKTYEKIRVGAKWTKLLKNLEYLNSHKKRPKIRIQITYQDQNRQEIEEFKTKFKPLCDELNIKPVRSDNSGGERKSCPQPRQRIVVGWDGKMYGCCNAWNGESILCCAPFPKLKTIFEPEYLLNDELKNLRCKAKNPSEFEPCKSCLIRSSYK